MGFREGKENTRQQISKFSVNEWVKFRERLESIKGKCSDRDYKILYEIIVNMISTAHLAYLARTDEKYSWCKSNQNKPMSVRRIQQILCEYFPEFHIWTSHEGTKKKAEQQIRTEMLRRKKEIKILKQCGRCGSKNNLELHHLFPVCLGGTNDDRNFIWLCHDCHKIQSLYFLERLKELKEATNESKNN